MFFPDEERHKRPPLPSEEFWAIILGMQSWQEEDLDGEIEPQEEPYPDKCGVCGSMTVCGYDINGDAWLHADGLKS